jgi:hypothetical protein
VSFGTVTIIRLKGTFRHCISIFQYSGKEGAKDETLGGGSHARRDRRGIVRSEAQKPAAGRLGWEAGLLRVRIQNR